MIKVSAILGRKGYHAISVAPETSVLDALKIMADKNIGSLVVMENGEYIGMMTERDYARKVALKNKHSIATKVSEIMSSDLPPIAPHDTLEHCMALMTENNIRYLPVFENGRVSGIISMSDVVKETIIAQKETISHLENYIHGQG